MILPVVRWSRSVLTRRRAYIAASRRSDRSLEARVESARRASEIHKRRTGRSLRVTEQDVINEEMYEEEDDDLPLQYRRLTAHLQTGSADFNRRLSAYLTNHVAMRSALDQAITNSYAQQYPNAPQFAHNQTMYPSPFMHQNMPPQRSPTSFQPYPSPASSSYRPSRPAHSSSSSHGTPSYSPTGMAAPSPIQGTAQVEHHRRSSASSHKSSSHSPQDRKATPVMRPNSVASKSSPTSGVKQDETITTTTTTQMRAPPQPSPQFQHMNGYPLISTSPFSTSLPAEAQMLLGGALDPHDPMTAMMMAGSENFPQPWNYNNTASLKPRNGFHQSFDGMSATLAPSALDMSHGNQQQYSIAPSSTLMAPAAGLMAGPYDSPVTEFSKIPMYSGHSSTGSGTVTPGADATWDAFINDNSWSEGNVT